MRTRAGVSSYAHGCNCAGAMGKGIAVQFKSKYPDMYLEYKPVSYTHLDVYKRQDLLMEEDEV